MPNGTYGGVRGGLNSPYSIAGEYMRLCSFSLTLKKIDNQHGIIPIGTQVF